MSLALLLSVSQAESERRLQNIRENTEVIAAAGVDKLLRIGPRDESLHAGAGGPDHPLPGSSRKKLKKSAHTQAELGHVTIIQVLGDLGA